MTRSVAKSFERYYRGHGSANVETGRLGAEGKEAWREYAPGDPHPSVEGN
jgi:hypothetical protein